MGRLKSCRYFWCSDLELANKKGQSKSTATAIICVAYELCKEYDVEMANKRTKSKKNDFL